MDDEYVKLGEICEVVSGATPKSSVEAFWDGDVKWITPAELDANTCVIQDSVRHLTVEGVKSAHLKPVPAGTVILSSRAPIGKTAIAGCELYCNQGFKNLICGPRVYNRFLYHFLSCKTEFLNSLGRGATFKELSKKTVESIEIKLPPLKEQKEIAAQFDSVVAIVLKLQALNNALNDLVKSQFVEMFGGGVYEDVPLADLLTSISDGTHKTPNYLDSGIRFISAKNITSGKLDLSDVKYISKDEYKDIQRRCRTERGDILLSKSGSLGTPIVLETDEPLGLFESLAVLKFDHDVLDSHFLCEQLKSDSVQKQFKGSSKGVAVKHLHLNVIKAVQVVVPPIERQREFAGFVQQVDKSKFAVQQSIEQLELLKAKLMQEYFA